MRKPVWSALHNIHSSKGTTPVNCGIQHQAPISPLGRLILE